MRSSVKNDISVILFGRHAGISSLLQCLGRLSQPIAHSLRSGAIGVTAALGIAVGPIYQRGALKITLNLMKSYSDYEAVTAIVRGLLVVALVVSQLKPQWLPRWPLTVTQGGWPSNWCCLCVPGILISTYTEVPDLHIPSINLPVYVKKKTIPITKTSLS